MNMNAMSPSEPSDQEVLAGVSRHMSDVEPLVPQPAAWDGGILASPATRTAVRSRIAFAGLAPLVLVAAAVVLVVGVGLDRKSVV